MTLQSTVICLTELESLRTDLSDPLRGPCLSITFNVFSLLKAVGGLSLKFPFLIKGSYLSRKNAVFWNLINQQRLTPVDEPESQIPHLALRGALSQVLFCSLGPFISSKTHLLSSNCLQLSAPFSPEKEFLNLNHLAHHWIFIHSVTLVHN
jgi:hypothetical protein